ncbi:MULTISPECIES: ABC transporter ATP-binding protein [Pseudomonas]|uniref:ABC-type dipeptide transporter n=1 Tax=Pseudomonas cichorii TaxID=36746 RepID=A0A3M4VZ41_PSECI|nr:MULTISPECIES: ABC transporter ATP-binding protein [Pseudomonas]AHF67220.1 dipeptide ABC transporter, ATP-binding protein [Pseudomonas cichorii JBC1]QVE19093.1 ABC transporter ATP-binding protein [Pseudomonas cichorii]RMR56649.1 Dipeptide ABC transporter, ATP-binding protein [Pseudomonas cichorii]SDN56128.1 peptide/nickel transport system ATP-binding protein/peptide/nickel transport system ATP-binding protein [Pseudomonas cichorii]GFM90491.1 peptide ABC transporter ATP-binding protein [Pseud
MSQIKLAVEDLRVEFTNAGKTTAAVRDVSFNLGREKLAIVGESGSGKSTVGRSLLRLHPSSARITAKTLRFGDIDLLSCSEKQIQGIRGRRMSMIMQDPKYSLNPVIKVGEQIAEAYLAHHKVSAQEARERTLDMLAKVHIRDPARVYDLYPHEVSGGMGQRIMIAMMVITDPQVIIADEPTSALDVSVRRQVLNVLEELVSERDLGLIFISHDLNLVRHFCDRVLVMYAGRVVESLDASELDHARHPYTQGLLAALPSLDRPRASLPVLQRDPLWLTH